MYALGPTIRQQCITRDRAARGLAQTAYRQYSVADARLPVIPVTLHLLRCYVTPSHEARRSMRLALTRALWHAYTASASRGGESVPRASADVAQWQSSGFVNRRLSVRARPSAPNEFLTNA